MHLSYKYVKSPHSIKVGVEAFKRVDLLNQVIEHSTFNTKVSVNGERITEVVCWLKNSNHQHFKLKLPEKCDLWKTKVDDKTVRSTTQDGYLQIPVPINSDPNKTIKVEFTYAEKGDALKEGLNLKVESPSFSSPSYELELTNKTHTRPLAEVRLRYRDAVDNRMKEFSTPVLQKSYNTDFEKCTSATRLAFISGKFAEVLKDGGSSEGITPDSLLKYLRPLSSEMKDQDVFELLRLIEKSR